MLFGLPSPDQVRQNQRQKLFGMAPQMFGSGAPGAAGTMGMALGMGLGKLFGGQNPEIARAQKIQQIQQSVQASMGDIDMSNPQNMFEMGKRLSGELLKAGETDLGLGVLQKISTLKPATSERDLEFWKEERKTADSAVKSAESQAASLRKDFGKLQQLSKRARGKGASARAARNSMIANIVRLNSPGIVSETELKTYTGGQGSTAAMLQYLQGKGVDTSAIMANLDPSGENFDVDGMLGLGKDLILGQAQPIFDRYEDARARALRSGMSERALNTKFGNSRNLEALKGLAQPTKQSAKPLNNQGSDINDLISKYAD